MVHMNLRTPFDVFCSTFQKNLQEHKEYDNDYTFDIFCILLINAQHRLLDKGKLGGKDQAHLLKRNGNMNYKERGHFGVPIHRP
jgi:hypothetical protein